LVSVIKRKKRKVASPTRKGLSPWNQNRTFELMYAKKRGGGAKNGEVRNVEPGVALEPNEETSANLRGTMEGQGEKKKKEEKGSDPGKHDLRLGWGRGSSPNNGGGMSV